MISLIMCTGRINPLFQEMCDGLVDQLQRTKSLYPEVELEFIVVDMRIWYEGESRKEQLRECVKGRFKLIHVPPKPNNWQGPTKLTKTDTWAKQSAINTGLIYANNPCIFTIDDCTLWTEDWMRILYEAYLKGQAAGGAYHYIRAGTAVIENGMLVGKVIDPGDHRIEVMSEPGPCPPAWCYGGNSVFPLWALIKCNGADELLDGYQGLDDCDTALRVGKLVPTWFYPQAGIYQITDTHTAPYFFASSTDNKSCTFPLIDQRGTLHNMSKNHLPIYWLHGMTIKWNTEKGTYDIVHDEEVASKHKARYTTLGNWFKITNLRRLVREGKEIPSPPKNWMRTDWRSGLKLEDL